MPHAFQASPQTVARNPSLLIEAGHFQGNELRQVPRAGFAHTHIRGGFRFRDRTVSVTQADFLPRSTRKSTAGQEAPNAVAYLSADRVHREAQRLQARLARVKARGGAYRGVEISEDVRALLGRLEAGATLSTYVH